MATKYIDVDGSMLDDVYELVRAFLNPDSTYERWAMALDPPWSDGRYPAGAATVVDGRMVAFLCLSHVERVVDGRLAKVCNAHSLITLPEFGGAAARLMLRQLKRREWSLTVFTPSRAVRDFLSGVGFQSMQDRVQVAPTIGIGAGERDRFELTFDHELVADRVAPDRAQLIDDHQGTLCRHLYIDGPDGGCHVAYLVSAVPRRHAVILSVSDPLLFSQASRAVRSGLRDQHRVEAMLVDSRMVGERKLAGAAVLPVDARRFVRPGTDGPPIRSIDNLYSEFPLLGVPFVPSPVDEARQILLPRIDQLRSHPRNPFRSQSQ